MYTFEIQPGLLTLAQLRKVARHRVNVSIASHALPAIHKSQQLVNQMIEENRTVYGINTGFGLLANTRIEVDDLEELQRSIVLSHAAGIGQFMDDATVRLVMV
ncbi:MAG: aromatic amino acid lyase, partial [Oceanospirillaceae bacterium]|nr:aromatic amino acid lyase [Oceanospirillaceae bacterium]